MIDNISETVELLFDKNNSVAYQALQILQKADTSIYADSMQSLVQRDIQAALKEIQK